MSDKLTRVVAKLNQETQEDKLKWKIDELRPISSLLGSQNLIDNVYSTEVNGKKLRLYKYGIKEYISEYEFRNWESYRLEFVDENNKAEWEFPNYSAVSDLYDSVRYKVANVSGFVDKFLEGYIDKDEQDVLSIF